MQFSLFDQKEERHVNQESFLSGGNLQKGMHVSGSFKRPAVLVMIKGADCQSCVDLVVSELNRIALDTETKGKLHCYVVPWDNELSHYLRRRYNSAFEILSRQVAIQDSEIEILGKVPTPFILVIDSSSRVAASRTVLPGSFQSTETFFDSVNAMVLR